VRTFDRMLREFWLNSVVGSPLLTVKMRAAGLRRAGLRLSDDVRVSAGVRFVSGYDVEFRDHVFVNDGCLFDAHAPIVLEANVKVAPGVQFLTSTHALSDDPAMRAGDLVYAAITVGCGSWIGARAVILPGVKVAPGCVIGAGAVVTASTEPNGLYLGVPARRVRTLSDSRVRRS
jgi:acetyltransferase-like isoleucine patch superfamily enzyme